MLTEGDALTAAWPDKIDAIISNIPYQISSPLIDALEKHRQHHGAPEVVVLLVQEEFAERLTLATPADRGSLGICTALGWSSTMERRVPPGAFRPPPAVMSRVCVLRPIELPSHVDHRLVRHTVHAAFHHRRRKLRTSLHGRHAACPACPAGTPHGGKRRSPRWRTTPCSIYAPRI